MPEKRMALTAPFNVRLLSEDLSEIESIADEHGEATSTVIRSLVSYALHQYRNGRKLAAMRFRGRSLTGKAPVSKTEKAGSSPAAPAKSGQRKNPVTDNPYTITSVSHTEEQEL